MKASFHERLSFWRKIVGNRRRLVCLSNFYHNRDGVIVLAPRRFSCYHFDDGAAETPDVSFDSILFLVDDFRGHVIGSAGDGAVHLVVDDVGEHLTAAEVSEFDDSLGGDKNVAAFDVPVEDALRVKIAKAFEDLPEVHLDEAFLEFAEVAEHLLD